MDCLLNQDVLVLILSELDIEDVFACALISKSWLKACRSVRLLRHFAQKYNCDPCLESIVKTRISVIGIGIRLFCKNCSAELTEKEIFPVFSSADMSDLTCLVVGQGGLKEALGIRKTKYSELRSAFSCFYFWRWEDVLAVQQYNTDDRHELWYSSDWVGELEDQYFEQNSFGYAGGNYLEYVKDSAEPEDDDRSILNFVGEESSLFCLQCKQLRGGKRLCS